MKKSVVAFVLPTEQITKKQFQLYKRLFKSQDVALLLRYEREITELFYKFSMYGQAFTHDPEEPIKQTTLFSNQ
tara:strand:- start:174 stop:395 length:222 start_codon:yes stop_codon:yes gene_type:complete